MGVTRDIKEIEHHWRLDLAERVANLTGLSSDIIMGFMDDSTGCQVEWNGVYWQFTSLQSLLNLLIHIAQ
jgi:hypothetical protein